MKICPPADHGHRIRRRPARTARSATALTPRRLGRRASRRELAARAALTAGSARRQCQTPWRGPSDPPSEDPGFLHHRCRRLQTELRRFLGRHLGSHAAKRLRAHAVGVADLLQRLEEADESMLPSPGMKRWFRCASSDAITIRIAVRPFLLIRDTTRLPSPHSTRRADRLSHGTRRPDWQVPGSWPVREPLQLLEPVEHHVDLARGWRFETTNRSESATVGGDVI